MSTIQKWYDFVLQQMAAEVYLENIDLGNNELVKERFNLGNNRPEYLLASQIPPGNTRFTDTQADDFLDRFQILHQLSDNPNGGSFFDNTGLSATLMLNEETDQYTLSIRSTEYQNKGLGGDFERDFLGGGGRDISNKGYAFAQIAALEEYYAYLKTTPGLLPPGATLNVTGYSLGGHLATVFTELHASEINHTYLFNAAGRGGVFAHRLLRPGHVPSTQLAVEIYRAVLDNPDAWETYFSVGPGDEDLDFSFHTAARDAAPVQTFVPDAPTRNGSIYVNARHVWALKVAGLITSPLKSIGGIRMLDAAANAKITDFFGHAAHNDSEWVASSGVRATEDRRQKIFIEDQPDLTALGGVFELPGDFGNTHSITLIADSLAVSRLLEKLGLPTQSQANLDNLYTLLAASSNQLGTGGLFTAEGKAEGDSLEKIIEALDHLFTTKKLKLDVDRTSRGFVDSVKRNAFYKALDAINNQLGPTPAGYHVISLTGMTADQLLQFAEDSNGIAYRYALKEGNSFAVIKDDALYAPHNSNSVLDLYDPSTRSGALTLEYLTQRARFLERNLYFNTEDARYDLTAGMPQRDAEAARYDGSDIVWKDYASDIFINRGTTASTRYVLFGSNISDVLTGNDQEDHLFGSSGNDILEGKAGDDYLEGGRGTDLYYYRPGDGADALVDQDREGLILYGPSGQEQALILATRNANDSENQYKSADGNITYTISGPDLMIQASDGSLTVKDFDQAEHDLNIRLLDLSTTPVTTHEILGDYGHKDFDDRPESPIILGRGAEPREGVINNQLPDGTYVYIQILNPNAGPGESPANYPGNENGIRYELDPYTVGPSADPYGPSVSPFSVWIRQHVLFSVSPPPELPYGTLVIDPNHSRPGIPDILFGGVENDHMIGGYGGDYLYGRGGDDWIEAGTTILNPDRSVDDDYVFGGAGDDLIEGGIDSDILVGGDGDDQLYAGFRSDYATIFTPGQTPTDDHEWLNGSNGNDFVVGSRGNDALLGGGGADTLLGGVGDDNLLGDKDWVAVAIDWIAIDQGEATRLFSPVMDGINTEAGGDDVLYGGDGNDWMLGEQGSDVLFGDNDNDFLDGDSSAIDPLLHGADILFGGAGNDRLFGNGGDDTLVGGGDDDYLVGDAAELSHEYHGNDHIEGGDGNDILFGQGGDDYLSGGGGEDTLDGGAGADMLIGGAGADSIFVEGSDDVVVIEGADQVHKIKEVADSAQTASDFTLEYHAGDIAQAHITQVLGSDGRQWLRIAFDADNSLLLQNGFLDDGQLFAFAGTTFNQRELMQRAPAVNIVGTAGNDVIYGSPGADTIDGGAGLDTIDGGGGDDTFVLGPENDIYLDTTGNNTYKVALGPDVRNGFQVVVHDTNGNDRLQFERVLVSENPEDPLSSVFITPTLQYASRDGDDLVIGVLLDDGIANTTPVLGTVRIVDQYSTGRIETIEGLRFVSRTPDNQIISLTEEAASQITGTYIDELGIPGYRPRVASEAYSANAVLQTGTGGDDALAPLAFAGPSVGNVFYGGTGNDALTGGNVRDVFHGGDGQDRFEGKRGSDSYHIDPSQPDIVFDDGRGEISSFDEVVLETDAALGDLTFKQDGNDLVIGNTRIERFFERDVTQTDPAKFYPFMIEALRGRGWDVMDLPGYLGTRDFFIQNGTSGNDTLIGGNFPDRLFGFEGNDRLEGHAGNDRLYGGEGNDVMDGGNDNDQLFGGSGDDALQANWGDDQIFGEHGNDGVQGWHGHDYLDGGAGDDQMSGGRGRDSLLGGDGRDVLFGDLIGDNTTYGNLNYFFNRASLSGNDVLDGGADDDVLMGGPGGDTYRIYRGGGRDLIEESSANVFQTKLNQVEREIAGLDTHPEPTYSNFSWYIYFLGEMNGGAPPADYPEAFVDAVVALSGEDGIPMDQARAALNEIRTFMMESQNDIVEFGEGIAADNISVQWNDGVVYVDESGNGITSPGLLWVDLGSNEELLIVDNQGGDDFRVERFRFSDGSELTLEQFLALESDPGRIGVSAGTADADILMGSGWYDSLYGYEGEDLLLGRGADDAMFGGAGNDVLVGGPGHDEQRGGGGADTYLINGNDEGAFISDIAEGAAEEPDTLSFGAGTTPQDVLAALQVGTNPDGTGYQVLLLRLASSGAEISVDWASTALDAGGSPVIADDHRIERVQFLGTGPRRVFDLAALVSAREAELQAAFDANPESPAYIPLFTPTSLSAYDITAMVGIAGGQYAINYAVTGDVFTPPPNQAPTVGNPLADAVAEQGTPFALHIPVGTFEDLDVGDFLTYTASRTDGTSLPAWLGFDADTQSFSGTAANSDVGSLDIRVTASDSSGAAVSDDFILTVANVNDAPTVVQPVPDQNAQAASPFVYQVPVETFNDVDAGDALAYRATQADGSALPAWLTFDATTRTFTGLPGPADVGPVEINILATDNGNLSATDSFRLAVAPAPIVGTASSDVLFGTANDDLILGGAGNDILAGGDGDDTLSGGAGADILYAGSGSDTLRGGDGNDVLLGGAGNDVMDGDAGSDVLSGGSGNDSYVFSRGYGADSIIDRDSTAGNQDKAVFGVNPLDLVFVRSGNDLQVRLHGGTDTLTVNSWYRAASFEVEQLQSQDNRVLLNHQIDQLIQAMATFSANNGGITWDQAVDQRPQEVEAIISAYWQAA